MTPSTQDARATGLVELAVRCEQATGADRELDADILFALDPKEFERLRIEAGMPCGAPDEMMTEGARERVKYRHRYWFSSSLDAVMTLIGKDAFWRLGNDGEGPDVSAFKATVTSGDGPTLAFHDAVAATPALALTAAALRALAASTKDMNHE